MHYIGNELEALIIRALRLYVDEFSGAAPEAEVKQATDYADALENDTYLLETTTPPDDAAEWPHINEQLAPPNSSEGVTT